MIAPADPGHAVWPSHTGASLRAATRRRYAVVVQGHDGWDDYAPFYDWENARTFGRRDVPFWRQIAGSTAGTVLELGCGTGRVTVPLARDGVPVVGIDRSAAMLARGRARLRRARLATAPAFVRGDIRRLPFPDRCFSLVMAPYGVLQSLLREKDLAETLQSVHRVLRRDGLFGLELVADLPSWKEYSNRVSLRGRRGATGARVTLVESVRQDRPRRLTLFDQEFVERRGRVVTRHAFTLAFRTLSVPQMTRRLAHAGFDVTSILGDYRGGPWDPRAEVWIVLARKTRL